MNIESKQKKLARWIEYSTESEAGSLIHVVPQYRWSWEWHQDAWDPLAMTTYDGCCQCLTQCLSDSGYSALRAGMVSSRFWWIEG